MPDIVLRQDQNEIAEPINPDDYKIAGFLPSLDLPIAKVARGMRESVRKSAELQVYANVNPDDYTDPELAAIITVQELQVLNGVDLAVILTRAEIVQDIRRQNLANFHPNQYGTLEEMARDQGISTSQLSQTMALVEIIFPFLEEHLNQPIAILWEKVGKSKFMEMIPVLKALITGDAPAHQTVQDAVAMLLDDVAATAATTGEIMDEQQQRAVAVDILMNQAETLTNRQLRNHIRPTEVPVIQFYETDVNGKKMLIAELTPDQVELFYRKLQERVETTYVDRAELRRLLERLA